MNKYLQQKTEQILQREAAKRSHSKKMAGLPDEFNFFDEKGELFKIMQLLPELQRALNSKDSEKVRELCILTNKRLKLIYQQHK